MVKSSLKPSSPPRKFLSEAEFTHQIIQNKPFLLDSRINSKTGDTLLHGMVREGKNFASIAYLLSRGQDMITPEGIDCKDLAPVNLNITNYQGQTPLQLAEAIHLQDHENQVIAELQSPKSNSHSSLVIKEKIYLALRYASEGKIIPYLNTLSQNEFTHKVNQYETSPTEDIYPDISQAIRNSAKNKTSYPYLDESMAQDKAPAGKKVRFAEKIEEQAIEAAAKIKIIPTPGYQVITSSSTSKRQRTK